MNCQKRFARQQKQLAKGILTSAIITALAFSTALVTGFPGLAELGLISGMGVLLCALATFIFLPALIALSDAEVDVESLPQPFSAPMLRRIVVARPIISISVAAVTLGFFGYQAFRYSDGALSCRINYDSNLLALQDQQLDAVRAERRLTDSGTETVLYAVSVARTWEDAIALRRRFLNLPLVARVSDGASKLPEPPNSQQMQLIRQLQQSASTLSANVPSIAPASHSVVGAEVDALYATVRKSPNPLAQRAARALDLFLEDLSKTPGRRSSDILTAYNDMVANWLIHEYADIARADDFQPVKLGDVPRELKNSYVRVDPDNTQHWALENLSRRMISGTEQRWPRLWKNCELSIPK